MSSGWTPCNSASSSASRAWKADGERKLDQMRATVDEKLHATLEARLGESFKQVADRAGAGAPRHGRDARRWRRVSAI